MPARNIKSNQRKQVRFLCSRLGTCVFPTLPNTSPPQTGKWKLREGDVPFQWSGKYKVVDVRDLDAYVDRQKVSAESGIDVAA
jgi:hypothetical protein